ncbi:MAG: redoxin domain-containing protein [Rubripirellula sp.]
MLFRSILSALVAGILCCPFAHGSEPTSHIGKKIEPFTLDNCYGAPVSLADFGDKKAIVVVFLGVECPLAKLYGPRLVELQKEFSDVAFIGINSNTQDSMTELKYYLERHDMKNIPFLKDVGNRVADTFGAERSPEAFLLDQNRVVRYHGPIDGQYLVGKTLARDYPKYVADAIQQIRAGEPIQQPEVELEGCYIGKVNKTEPTGSITYTKHIAPILNEHCVRCHREQEIAPFTLTSYDDILGWEDTILEVINDNPDTTPPTPPRMPPWFAAANEDHAFANDARLSQAEKKLIFDWVENGMPEGDPADLPEPPNFTLGWQIPEPDQVFNLSQSKVERSNKRGQLTLASKGYAVPAEGIIDYQYSLVDPGWEKDMYVYAAEARPGNRSVVHHIIAYVVDPREGKRDIRHMLAGYAPGSLPMTLPKGVALKVPAGSKLLFEMHYTPNGKKQTDDSIVGVCFMEKEDVERSAGQLICAEREHLKIEPELDNQEVKAETIVERDVELLNLTPHMHLRGKAFKYEITRPGEKEEIILDVPAYDFNWQLTYRLQEPLLLPRGTRIRCTAVYDNSPNNLSNPDPIRTVTWGDQSDEEMMIGFMGTVEPLKKPKRKRVKARSNEVSQR